MVIATQCGNPPVKIGNKGSSMSTKTVEQTILELIEQLETPLTPDQFPSPAELAYEQDMQRMDASGILKTHGLDGQKTLAHMLGKPVTREECDGSEARATEMRENQRYKAAKALREVLKSLQSVAEPAE